MITDVQQLKLLQALETDSKYAAFVLCNKETETTVTIENNINAENLAIEYGLSYELINDKKHFKIDDLSTLFINIITIATVDAEAVRNSKKHSKNT